MNKRVIILTFSSRSSGNCARIGKFIQSHYTMERTEYYSIDNRDFAPCNHCNYECLQPDTVCPNLTDGQRHVMDALCACDLAYFIVPNYCGGPCANYYAFNERTVGYFNLDSAKLEAYMAVRKRFIIVSNTDGFESAMAQQTYQTPEILYLKTHMYKKNSIDGDLLESEDARADLVAFLNVDL